MTAPTGGALRGDCVLALDVAVEAGAHGLANGAMRPVVHDGAVRRVLRPADSILGEELGRAGNGPEHGSSADRAPKGEHIGGVGAHHPPVSTPDVFLAAAMIGRMGMAVSEWWSPELGYSADQVMDAFVDGLLRILGVNGAS